MGLLPGEEVSLDALLHGLMRISGYDAANALAEAVGTTVPNFVDGLNEYIWSLGCTNTQFRNPHGIHHEEHFTTAYDMFLITKRALKLPKFRQLVSNSAYNIPKTNKQDAKQVYQNNALIRQGKHFYPKAIGVKTGFHSVAQFTLVAAAEHAGRTLIAVLLGCKNRDDRYEDAIRLFETAFAEKPESRFFFGPRHFFTYAIEGAKNPLQASHRKKNGLVTGR